MGVCAVDVIDGIPQFVTHVNAVAVFLDVSFPPPGSAVVETR